MRLYFAEKKWYSTQRNIVTFSLTELNVTFFILHLVGRLFLSFNH